MFEWHFTIRGADGTDFEGGMYHGRILLPPEYPMRPPNIIFLTPSGRFETNTKICLSFSAFHPELWQPAWGIRLILEALISFLPTAADGAIGALDWSAAERKKLAAQSVHHECPICGKIAKLLPEAKKSTGADEDGKKPSRFQKEIEELQKAQQMQHALDVHKGDASRDVCEEIKNEATVSVEHTPDPISSIDNNPAKDDVPSKGATENDDEKREEEEEQQEEVEIVFSKASSSGEGDKQASTISPPHQQDGESRTVNENEMGAIAFNAIVAPAHHRQQEQQHQHSQSELSSSWFMSDPVLHAIILVLSLTCYLLLRKIDAVMEEIYALESES